MYETTKVTLGDQMKDVSKIDQRKRYPRKRN